MARFHSAEESTAATLGPPSWLVEILLAAKAAATLKRTESHSKVDAVVRRTVPKKPPRLSHEMAGDVPEN